MKQRERNHYITAILSLVLLIIISWVLVFMLANTLEKHWQLGQHLESIDR